MKVSIIGTNGFLSTAMAHHCNAKNWNVDMYGLSDPVGHTYNHFHKVNLLSDQIDYVELCKSDVIVYASGAGIQSNLKESTYLIYALNVTVPVNICDQLKVNGFKGVFITFGSVFEMGKTVEQRAFTEQDLLTSICVAPNDYTISKRMLTRFIDGYSHDYVHWHFFIPTIYGEKENPLRLIPYTINAIKNGEKLSFTAGDQVRSYIYVKEIPLIIEKSLEKYLPSGLYNIGGADTLSVKEIVTLIHHEMGKEVPEDCFGTAQRRDAGMKYLELNGNKLYSAIKYEPGIHICDVIQKYEYD